MSAAIALFHPWSSFEALLKGIGHADGLIYYILPVIFALVVLFMAIEQFHQRPATECGPSEPQRRRMLEACATIAVLLAVRRLLPASQRLSLFLCGLTLAFLAVREAARVLSPHRTGIIKALRLVRRAIALFSLVLAAFWIWLYMAQPYID